MGSFLLFAVAIACVAYLANGQPGGGGGDPPKGKTPPVPPNPKEYKKSAACFDYVNTTLRSLATEVGAGEPYEVPQPKPEPCGQCLVSKLYTMKAVGPRTRICCKDKDEQEEIYYNFTTCFEVMLINCTKCKSPGPDGKEKEGDMIMTWKEPCVHTNLYKDDVTSEDATVMSTALTCVLTHEHVLIECIGSEDWIKACQTSHECGSYLGICSSAATGVFPSASNQKIAEKKKVDEKNNKCLGELFQCSCKSDLEGNAAEEDVCSGE